MSGSTPSSVAHSNKHWTRFWMVVAIVFVVWLVVAYLVAPKVIRDAYAGESLGILNRIITNPDAISVEVYLDAWQSIAFRFSLVLAGLGVLAIATMLFGQRVKAVMGPRLGVWAGADAAPLTARELLAWAFATGFIMGYVELGAIMLRRTLTSWPGYLYSREAVWMTPAMSAMIFGSIGMLLAGVHRFKPRVITWRVAQLLLWGIATYGVLRASFGGLATWAAAILAAGLAVRLNTTFETSRVRLRSLVPRIAIGGLVLVLVLAPGMAAARWVRERVEWARHSPGAGGPNVLLLVLDTVRSASLSLYGYERSTSPHLEQWAERGIVFDRTVAPAPWTLPSHASMFSGSLYHNATWDGKLEWAGPTLAEMFTEMGYATGGFMANHFYGPEYFGLQRGFTRYHSYPVSWEMLRQSTRLAPGRDRNPILVRAEDINRHFLDWQENLPEERPFFAFLNYIDAHEPYRPPEPYATRYAPPGGLTGVVAGTPYAPEEVQEFNDAYDGALAYIDDQIHELLTTLDERGALDNTVVIITSDHGEEFMEHGVMGHSMSTYIASLHVPLVMIYPARIPGGGRIGTTVSLTDIPATIMDLAGAPASFPGVSLAKRWEQPGRPEAGIAYSELVAKGAGVRWEHYPIFKGEMKSLVLGNMHYILNGDGREEVYDLAADPWERADLSDSLNAEGALAPFRSAMRSFTPEAKPPPQ